MNQQNKQPGSLRVRKRESMGEMLQKSHWQKAGLLDELMRPDLSQEYVPQELKKKKRKLRR